MHRRISVDNLDRAREDVLEWPMTSSVEVRPATRADLESMLALAARSRQDYAAHQPRFWRAAPDAVQRQRPFFASLVEDDDVLTLVATRDARVVGFLVARTVPAPPVYAPGGATCLVDDFTMEQADDWPTVGSALLQAVRTRAAALGAVQLVVVTAHLDKSKRTALQTGGLTIGSEWWVSETRDQGPAQAMIPADRDGRG